MFTFSLGLASYAELTDPFQLLNIINRTLLVYSGIFTFLVDAYPSYAASALAANSFARSMFGGIFPLFGIQSKCTKCFELLPRQSNRRHLTHRIKVYERLGYHLATSLLAFLTLLMAPFP